MAVDIPGIVPYDWFYSLCYSGSLNLTRISGNNTVIELVVVAFSPYLVCLGEHNRIKVMSLGFM